MKEAMRKARSEQGFSLVELLVVVIIIGILAGVAVPIYLNQRKSAWRSSVQNDVQQRPGDHRHRHDQAQRRRKADDEDQ